MTQQLPGIYAMGFCCYKRVRRVEELTARPSSSDETKRVTCRVHKQSRVATPRKRVLSVRVFRTSRRCWPQCEQALDQCF